MKLFVLPLAWLCVAAVTPFFDGDRYSAPTDSTTPCVDARLDGESTDGPSTTDAASGGAALLAGALPSSESCGKCHKEIYEQWKSSLHAQAWTSPTFQAWTKTKKKPDSCYRCHAPQPVLGVAPKRPKTRDDRREEGIGCVDCHVLDGKTHGPHGGRPCNGQQTAKHALFGKGAAGVDLCQSCHRITPKPVISLGKDFEKAKLAEKGKSCKQCHMPEVEGVIAYDPETGKPSAKKRKFRSHVFQGASHKDMVAKAFKLTVAKKDGKIVASVSNETGHRLPGLTLRQFKLRFELVDAKGKALGGGKEAMITSKKPIKVESSLEVELDANADAKKLRMSIEHLWQSKPKGPYKSTGTVFEDSKPIGG